MGEKDRGSSAFDETTDLVRRRGEPTQIDFRQPEKTAIMRDEAGIGRQIVDAGFSVEPVDLQRIIEMCKEETTKQIDAKKVTEILSFAKGAKSRMDQVFPVVFSKSRGMDTHDFENLDNVLSYCKSLGLFLESTSKSNGPVVIATSEIPESIIIGGKKEKVAISYGIDISADYTDTKYRVHLPSFFAVHIVE